MVELTALPFAFRFQRWASARFPVPGEPAALESAPSTSAIALSDWLPGAIATGVFFAVLLGFGLPMVIRGRLRRRRALRALQEAGRPMTLVPDAGGAVCLSGRL